MANPINTSWAVLAVLAAVLAVLAAVSLRSELRGRLWSNLSGEYYGYDAMVDRDVIHYSYGDKTWSKRSYFTTRQARKVWSPPAVAQQGTILAELLSQIREARDFYSKFH